MLTLRRAFRLAMVAVAPALAGCHADGPPAGGHGRDTAREVSELLRRIDDDNRAYRERQRLRSIVHMSLDRMFPDRRVRELAAAAGRGRLARVDELLAAGVDPNARGTSGATPLWWAFSKRSLRGFVRLLEAGADPNLTMGTSKTTVMHEATWPDDLRFLETALAHGGDTEIREGIMQWTPVFKSAMNAAGDVRALKMLMAAGADLEAEDEDGYTVAMFSENRPDVLYELVIRSADYRKTYPNGDTLLGELSAFCGRARPVWRPHCGKVIDWLVSQGVELPPPQEL